MDEPVTFAPAESASARDWVPFQYPPPRRWGIGAGKRFPAPRPKPHPPMKLSGNVPILEA